jgi:hypothetical protein
MLPPGAPPSALFWGLIWRNSYCGPPAARIASTNACHESLASVVPSFTSPLLS